MSGQTKMFTVLKWSLLTHVTLICTTLWEIKNAIFCRSVIHVHTTRPLQNSINHDCELLCGHPNVGRWVRRNNLLWRFALANTSSAHQSKCCAPQRIGNRPPQHTPIISLGGPFLPTIKETISCTLRPKTGAPSWLEKIMWPTYRKLTTSWKNWTPVSWIF